MPYAQFYVSMLYVDSVVLHECPCVLLAVHYAHSYQMIKYYCYVLLI